MKRHAVSKFNLTLGTSHSLSVTKHICVFKTEKLCSDRELPNQVLVQPGIPNLMRTKDSSFLFICIFKEKPLRGNPLMV